MLQFLGRKFFSEILILIFLNTFDPKIWKIVEMGHYGKLCWGWIICFSPLNIKVKVNYEKQGPRGCIRPPVSA